MKLLCNMRYIIIIVNKKWIASSYASHFSFFTERWGICGNRLSLIR